MVILVLEAVICNKMYCKGVETKIPLEVFWNSLGEEVFNQALQQILKQFRLLKVVISWGCSLKALDEKYINCYYHRHYHYYYHN